MTITADAVVNILAGADAPLSSSAVAMALKTSQTRKVVSVLTDLVRDETLERVGSQYRLRDAGRYDTPLATGQGTRRILLPTDKQAIAAGERRKAVAKRAKAAKESTAGGVNVFGDVPAQPQEEKTPQTWRRESSSLPNGTIPVDKSVPDTRRSVDKPITTLEEVEAKVDEDKARDQRIRDAIQRLKLKSNFRVDPVADLEFKIEILDGIGSADPVLWDLLKEVIADLRRLDELSVGPF